MRKIRFLIAFGPTREPLDPVRFISNYSTGTMGRHLVEAAEKAGHRVRWVECPKDAQTARDLERKLRKLLPQADALVMAAAVCDVRPKVFSSAKIRKSVLRGIPVVKNPDILAGLSRIKRPQQIFVGFGIESARLVENGRKKLRGKGLELIVLQKVTRASRPFGERKVNAVLLGKGGSLRRFRGISKSRLARVLVSEIESILARWPSS